MDPDTQEKTCHCTEVGNTSTVVIIVITRYISNPCLINGSKFDLRVYVYVKSFDPLRIYVYRDGLVRFATTQ